MREEGETLPNGFRSARLKMKNKRKKQEEKEYAFAFAGTREELVRRVHTLQKGHDYSFHKNYMIFVKGEELSFGIERAGHSGGYWFVPTVTEEADGILLRGKIQYIGPMPDPNRTRLQRIREAIGEILLLLLLLPLLLVTLFGYYVFQFFRWISGKPRPLTTEERLYDLMEKHVQCQRK